MNAGDTNEYHGENAAEYDRQAHERGCHAHEALFGLMYEFIKPGDTLLDVGIGTGLGSMWFYKAGLRVSGFDNARDMLEACECKGFAEQLIRHDLHDVPYPYSANSFDHAICLAVLNFFADVSSVFRETARILRPQGVFGFTVEERKPNEPAQYVIRTDEGSDTKGAGAAVTMYRHSDGRIRELLADNGFVPLKDFEFLVDQYPSQGLDIYFKAYVAQLGGCDQSA